MLNHSFKPWAAAAVIQTRTKQNTQGYRQHWSLYGVRSNLISGMKDKYKGVDLTVPLWSSVVPCLWSDSRIRRWISGLCGEVTTHCTVAALPLCGNPMEELGYWKVCVLAHPALSVRSNHRQNSLCWVAVCAAGSAVLIETQKEIRESKWLQPAHATY